MTPGTSGGGEADQQRRQMWFDWIRSEQDVANSRLSSYVESDQKIIAVIGTVIVAIIGLASSKFAEPEQRSLPYILFLSSGLMSLAVNQSSLYSSLALLQVERSAYLADRLRGFLNCRPDFGAEGDEGIRYETLASYMIGVVPYFLFKASIAPVLTAAGYFYTPSPRGGLPFWLALSAASLFSALNVLTVASHAVQFFGYVGKNKDPGVHHAAIPDAERSVFLTARGPVAADEATGTT